MRSQRAEPALQPRIDLAVYQSLRDRELILLDELVYQLLLFLVLNLVLALSFHVLANALLQFIDRGKLSQLFCEVVIQLRHVLLLHALNLDFV